MNYKQWSIAFLTVMLLLLVCVGSVVAVIDPYFHYHEPLSFLQYPIFLQRYQNDGILRHFEYDAIITGSSMTENFKSSEFDALFGVSSVKVPYAGGSFKEINDVLERALEHNPDVRYVVRGLDTGRLMDERNSMRYEESSYPTYLYDDILYNDVKYVFNKEVMVHAANVLKYTLEGKWTTPFDLYSNWMPGTAFGKDTIMSTYTRAKKVEADPNAEISLGDLAGNITQNVTALAKENPDVTFYYFFTPYSIFWWDNMDRQNNLVPYLCAFEEATRLILEYENIQLYCFYDDYEMVCNPDNYRDIAHYSEAINSQMLEQMKNGEHRLTKDNYVLYWAEVRDFYVNYNYDQLFA